MKNFIKNRFGLVLSEALLAIAMLSIGVLIVGTIINNALTTTALSKNYLIAQNLATEGIEAVKSIRDTNWLLEPDDKNCWLRRDTTQACNFKVVTNGNYTAVKDANNKWKLVSKGANLPAATDTYVLYIKTNNVGDDQYKTYVHDVVINNKSNFYRGIHVLDIIDEDGDGVQDYATFEISVFWKEGAKTTSLKRSVVLYNY